MSKGTESLSTTEPTIYDKARKVATRAGILIGGLALTACGAGESTKAVDPEPSKAAETPAATASSTPSVEAVTEATPETPAATPTTETPYDERESNIYDATRLTPDELTLVETMDQMDIKQFEAAPLYDRLIYVLGKNHEAQLYFPDFVDQVWTDTTPTTTLSQHSPVFLPLNEKSDAKAIYKASTYNEQLYLAWQQDEEAYGSGPLDNLTARKMVSGLVLDPLSPEYASHAENADVNTQSVRLTDESINSYIVGEDTKTFVVKNPIDNSQTIEKAFDVTLNGTTITKTHTFIPMPNQLGKGNGLWLVSGSTE